MLKPIPRENSEQHDSSQALHPASQTGKAVTRHKKTSSFVPKLVQKLEHQWKSDKTVLQTVCVKMIKFVQKEKQQDEREVRELIHGLQKSILSLQRHRQKLVWAEQKKKKRK